MKDQTSSSTDEASPSSPQARSLRLKEARRMAKLTLRGMSEGGNINFNTLCGWEVARHGGLTPVGADKVVERLLQEGIVCTSEWLLHGVGTPPLPIVPKDIVLSFHRGKAIMRDFIPNQIRIIEQQFPDFLGLIIQDRAMEPQYSYGDYVVGMPLPLEKLPLAVGKIVIAKIDTGKTYCRQLAHDRMTGHFALVAPRLQDADAIITNINITACAVVMGHFRYDAIYESNE